MDFGLRELFDLLWRRKLLVFTVTAGLTALAAAALFSIAPRYTAEALVLVDSRTVNLNLQSTVAALPRDSEAVESEIEILSSGGLATRVISSLDLHRLAEFNVDLEAEGARAPAGTFEEQAELTRSRVVNEFVDRLNVFQRGDSRAIAVRFTSEDPALAARIANTLTDAYLEQQLEAKFEATTRASSWLGEQVATMQEDLAELELNVERQREQSGLLRAKGETLTSQEIAELNTAVLNARTAKAEARARLGQLEATLSEPGFGANAAATVLDSELIQRLTEEEAGVRRRLAELSVEYGDLHPRMISLRAEAEDLQWKIRTETEKVVASLRNEVAVASAREASLIETLDAAKQRSADDNESAVELSALEREASAKRALLEAMMARLQETVAQEEMDTQHADSRVISAAQLPAKPSFPLKTPLLVITAAVGLLIGVLCAFVFETMDRSLRSASEVERVTGLPNVGFVPEIRDLRGSNASDYALHRQGSAFSGSVRDIFWGLKLHNAGDVPSSVLVTSSVNGEGKTAIASALARLLANPGRKVLLIDADCRRPTIHEHLDLPLEPGLTDVLTGQSRLGEVLQIDAASGARVIAAGSPATDMPGLLGSSAFDDLLASARSAFDLVIVDAPPIMVGADASILARKLASVVLVIRWAHTPRKVVEAAVAQLGPLEKQLVAAALSIVKVRKHARFSFGDSGRYAGKLASYYDG